MSDTDFGVQAHCSFLLALSLPGLLAWMRSHLLARRTRSLVKTLPNYHRAHISSTHALRYPRKDRASSQSTPHLSRRAISSETTPHDVAEVSGSAPPPASPPPSDAADTPPPPEDTEDKPKRRTRVSASAVKDADSVQLPASLNILWTPEDVSNEASLSASTTLPPPEIFNGALHNLHIVLHPQTQHRATYTTAGPLVEPTLALYCPIEGGDYILDETVKEMARCTDADVVVLDAVQLAAGECGHFGKGVSSSLAIFECARARCRGEF